MSSSTEASETTQMVTPGGATKPKMQSVWAITWQRGLAELFAIVLFGVFAVHARTMSSVPGPEIGNYLSGFAYFAAAFATNIIFGAYMASYLSFHVLFTIWFGWDWVDNPARLKWSSQRVWIPTVVQIIVQGGAWFIVAVIGWGIFRSTAFNLALALTVPTIGDGVVFLLEFLGKLLIDLVVIFSAKYNSVWSWFAVSLSLGVAVAVLGPITGGSLNAWRSLAIPLVQGADLSPVGNELVQLAYWGSELAAPIAAVVIKVLLFNNNKAKPGFRPINAKQT